MPRQIPQKAFRGRGTYDNQHIIIQNKLSYQWAREEWNWKIVIDFFGSESKVCGKNRVAGRVVFSPPNFGSTDKGGLRRSESSSIYIYL